MTTSPCKTCGTCPTCGRRPVSAPVNPFYPWVQQPQPIWVVPTPTWQNPYITYTVSCGTDTATPEVSA